MPLIYFVLILNIDTNASEKISAIICNKSFCCDVKKLSPVYQTSQYEAFHSLIIKFAPKSTAFSLHGIIQGMDKDV